MSMRPEWIDRWTPRILVVIFVALVLLSGCAGTKMANSANSHELERQGATLQKARNLLPETAPELLALFNEIGRRWERMSHLQGVRNQVEGMANVAPSDDLLPVAIVKLREQGASWNFGWGIVNAAGGALFGGYWKEIIGLLVAAGVTGLAEYKRRQAKKLATANTQAIEAYAQETSRPEGDRLKNLARLYQAKNFGPDKLVQNASVLARADYRRALVDEEGG